MWQLRLQKISDDEYRIGEILIQNLDDNGFHIEDPESIVKEYEKDTLKKVMKIIQGFDPIGVCTKDFKESLLVQINNHFEPNPHALEIVEKHFKLLERGKHADIAKKMKITEEKVRLAEEFIKTLDPMPGRNYSTERAKYVIPDVLVKLKDGEFVIVLNDEEIPVLSVNPFFEEISDEKNTKDTKELNKFVTEKINDARWFIRSIGQRNETLLKTVRAIVEFQRDFFRNGPKYLVPLVLKDVAREIDVHEATVSRATKEKYIQTEWGIFELKYFFSNAITGSGSRGSKYSKQAVKEIIKEIIMNNTEEKQLSDSKIAEILLQRGIKIARRTVAKYRGELNINSSFLR
jgi:RNA polymerase sigma-54 factor